MRIRRLLATTALLPLAAMSVAAMPVSGAGTEGATCKTVGQTSGGEDRLACTSDYYLDECDQAIGGKVWDSLSGMPNLVEDAPEASFTTGAGCGWAEVPLFGGVYQDTPYDFNFAGYVSGNIDSLAVDLHDIYVGPERRNKSMKLEVRISIEGESPFGYETNENVSGEPFDSPGTAVITVTPEVSSTGVSEKLSFTVTGLSEVLGLADEAGAGDEERYLIVTIAPPLGGHAFVWGASEIATGVTLNPEKIHGTPVAAFS